MSDETDVMERAFTAPLLRAIKPRYSIEPVLSRNVVQWWPAVQALVEQACISPDNAHLRNLDDVLIALTTAENQLWLVVGLSDEPGICGVLVSCVHNFPRARLVEISIAGHGLFGWRSLAEQVVGVWAKQIGATHLMVRTPHPNLARLARRRGFKTNSVVLTKELV